MLHRFIRLPWLFLLLALLSPLSHAESNPAVALRNLHQAQMNLNATAATFHRYLASEGDSKQLIQLNEALSQLKSSFQTSFKDLADLGMKAELEKILGHWRAAAKDLNSAMTAIAGNGYAEGQVINGYLLNSFLAGEDLKNAYKAVLTTTGVRLPAALQSLRDEAVLFQEMSALYMEQSTTQYAYTYRSEANNSDTLDKMAQRFSFGLDDTEKLLSNNADAVRQLNQIRNKWQFLEKSFVNYTEKSVPYLVVKFGGEITTDLEALAAQYDKG